MRVTLLGFTIPSSMLRQINGDDQVSPAQTYRFAWGLVRALGDNGAQVGLLSTAPVSDFPRNPKVLWGRRRFSANGIEGLLMPFANLAVLKHLSRYLSCWLVGIPELRRTRPDWIVVHGVHSPFLWFTPAAAKLLRARAAVVLTDPPGVVRSEDGRIRTALKRLDIWMVRRALKRFHAAVALSEPLARDFAPGVPSLVMEGLYDSPRATVHSYRPTPRGDSIVFAGTLLEEYGVKRLVEAFRSLALPNIRLNIYGRGPLEPWLIEQASQDPRITEPRLVGPDELSEIYATASVLVQPRQADQAFVPYSFPSKLIEYLASGAVVVSTRLPSIPADYAPYAVWSDGDESSDLAAALTRVLDWSTDQRDAFGNRAASFIRETRSTNAQGKRIVNFFASLEEGRAPTHNQR